MRTFVRSASALIVGLLLGCGGGGGKDTEYDIGLIAERPSAATLCELTIGVSTLDDVERALGEPTNESESSQGVTLQYWYGSYEEFSTGQGATLVFGFDTEGHLDSPLVMGMTYPQCWRDQLAAMD